MELLLWLLRNASKAVNDFSMDYPKLNRPPVVEAVMGVFILENELWRDYYKDVVEIIKDKYTVINERVVFRSKNKASNTVDNTDLLSPQVIKDGYTLSNPEQKKVLLLKPDIIQITKKAPYVEWNDLFLDFKEALQALSNISPNVVFSKPYLKYRNEFLIPVLSDDSMNKHFTIVHYLPDMLTKFSIHNMGFSIDTSDENYLYKIEQRLKPSDNPENISATINIDTSDTSIKSSKNLDVVDSIERMREKKNQLFFNLITENVLQLFV